MTDAAVTMRSLVLDRAGDPGVGLRTDQGTWTWSEVVDAARVRAAWMDSVEPRGERDRAHVGVLMDNVPEFAFLLAAAGLADAVLVGLNPTRTGQALARDVDYTACDVVLTEPGAAGALGAGLDVPVLDVTTDAWRDALSPHADAALPGRDVDPTDPYVFILTSGTTSAPKAVVCSTGKIGSQGSVIPHIVELTADDTTYAAMPLFHSNAIIAGWTPTLTVGATLALPRRFSASRFLDDVRAHGASYANYVGTPLSYVLAQPERDDDADNPLRVLFGNEAAPHDIARFAERFGCRIVDAYGSTEGGIAIVRTEQTPTGALGVPVGDVAVLDTDGEPCALAELDDDGRLTNPDEAIGELVRMDGAGAFEGYWDHPEANADRVRDGRYHSGDLGYRDAEGFLWFAGRTDDWIRVGGENFAAAPVQRALADHPDVTEAVVVGVPDATAGDQVLAVLVADRLDVDALPGWIDDRDDLPARWRPRYLRVVDDVPRTGTGKTRRRDVRDLAWAPADTLVRDGDRFRPLTDEDRAALRRAFAEAGRDHLLPAADPDAEATS